ncbi:trypsin-like peptidase domain protein [Halobacteriovorax sp. BALOs_7]|uniref:trypsin-like serine peptidase n=1 Tax=Halobacteriovorax sp. BALOs_7 TaxID=2109558 RepID=UPI000EA1109C|nr:serine protease [Halobacteriovorax sp. BALOs_7]AYF43395.1 trypsin-like peptidase domain protein [Halobacteriovorax sp. BALOs_7]
MSVKGYMVFLVVMSTFLTVSCGDSVPAGSATSMTGSIIVGEVDWVEVTTFDSESEIRKNSKAVADVQFANGGRCTGFFVSDDVLMTNEHCVGSASDVVGMKVFMKHEKGVPESEYAEVKCNEFIGNDVTLDYALVKCEGSPGQRYGKVTLETTQAVEGDSIYIIQQNCDYYSDYNCNWNKKVSEGKVVGVETDVFYDADTLGGSSGSPVFNADSDKVFAIHHAGYGGGWTGRGIKNAAVPMSKIVPHMQANFPSVLADSGDSSDDGSTTPSQDNNTFETAAKLESGDSFKAEIESSQEMDFYKVEMKAGEVLDFEIKFSHAQGDLDFVVYKKVGGSFKVVSRKQSSTDDERVRLRVSTSKTYYVKVYGYRGATAEYEVKFKK